MKVTLVPATGEHLSHIVENLRKADHDEIFCTRRSEATDKLTAEMEFVIGLEHSVAVIALLNGVPAAALGAVEPWPGVWEVWAFGTDSFERVALTLTRYTRRILLPTLLERGARRLQCRSLATHTKAHDWLRSFGARQNDERVLRAWGKNGEDFVLFEMLRGDLVKIYDEEAA